VYARFKVATVQSKVVNTTKTKLIQCVPNLSEGRDLAKLELFAKVIEQQDVRFVDWSADPDHNRSVFTFVGSPSSIVDTAIALVEEAVKTLDVTKHAGVHPRFGVVDVLPFVPLLDVSMEECVVLAHSVGLEVASRFRVPVFYYDYASSAKATLPEIRKGAFLSITPDVGPSDLHSTAGAVAVGARHSLIAFNVNLVAGSLREVKDIARKLRAAYPDTVRALGLYLPIRNIYQVSINVVRPDKIDLLDIIVFIEDWAEILETELVGALPGFSAYSTVKSALKLTTLRPQQLLVENWPNAGLNC
jgi:glutamate formiminotransferase